VRIEQRRQHWSRRRVAPVIGIAQDKFTGFHQVDRVGLAQPLIGAANRRLRKARICP
jgi:hypothetical protein